MLLLSVDVMFHDTNPPNAHRYFLFSVSQTIGSLSVALSFLHPVELTRFSSQSNILEEMRGAETTFSLGGNFAFSGCQARCWEEICLCKLSSVPTDQQTITQKTPKPVCTCHCGGDISIHGAHGTTCWRPRHRGQSLDALPQRRV